MAMYVRVKRKNQTLFVYYEPSETVVALKGKLESIVKVSTSEMRLYADVESAQHAMPDKETLEKLGVLPEQELALVFKVPGEPRSRLPPRTRVPPRGRLYPRGTQGWLAAGCPWAASAHQARGRSDASTSCAGSDDWEPIDIASDASQLADEKGE